MRSWGAADWKNGNQVAGGMEFETAPGALPFFSAKTEIAENGLRLGPKQMMSRKGTSFDEKVFLQVYVQILIRN